MVKNDGYGYGKNDGYVLSKKAVVTNCVNKNRPHKCLFFTIILKKKKVKSSLYQISFFKIEYESATGNGVVYGANADAEI